MKFVQNGKSNNLKYASYITERGGRGQQKDKLHRVKYKYSQ
jgi:hypothetical protein